MGYSTKRSNRHFLRAMLSRSISGVNHTTVTRDYSIPALRSLATRKAVDLDDRLGYGASPVAAYAAALVSAAFIFAHFLVGPPLLAGALILLLIVNIRNAWDLTIWFGQRRTDGDPPPPNPTP